MSKHRTPRENRWMWRYKLTADDVLAMLIAQSYACAICKTVFVEDKFVVDHDHRCCPGETSCGKCVRGLLCVSCNTKLGWFQGREAEIHAYLNGAG